MEIKLTEHQIPKIVQPTPDGYFRTRENTVIYFVFQTKITPTHPSLIFDEVVELLDSARQTAEAMYPGQVVVQAEILSHSVYANALSNAEHNVYFIYCDGEWIEQWPFLKRI